MPLLKSKRYVGIILVCPNVIYVYRREKSFVCSEKLQMWSGDLTFNVITRVREGRVLVVKLQTGLGADILMIFSIKHLHIHEHPH